MQGVLPDGSAFLVSGFSSERWYSEALLEEGEMAASAPLPPKACRALSLLLEKVNGRMADGRIQLRSNIPPGKGLSSSSTDVLSVLSVANDYLGAGLLPEELYHLATRVEPTDPCLSDDIVLFHQHSGVKGRAIGLPPVSLLYFDADPGREIETERVRRPWTPGAGKFFDWLLCKFLRAAEAGDYGALFDSITYSAEYNQTVIGLARFDEWLRLAREMRVGLMVAHSGTFAGLLTRPGQEAAVRERLLALTDQPIYSEQYLPSLF